MGGFTVVLLLFCFSDRKNRAEELNVFLISALGFVLKCYYVLITPISTRQHDVGTFGGTEWHSGYIEYILNNHRLPDVNPVEMWQSHHPPLHHFISAIWIGILENVFTVSPEAARESLQVLTLLYSMCIVILSLKLFRFFNLKGHALYLPLLIVSFHPSIILLSGSINNDTLATCFLMASILSALKWYKEQSLINILKLALFIGLGMMTKISVVVIAPAVAFVFLLVLIKRVKEKASLKEILSQFLAFCSLCFPLGLWFPLRNSIKWGLPFLYSPGLPDNIPQKIKLGFWSRITDFSPYQISNVYEQWWHLENGIMKDYNEYNPIIATLKTSLFGEFINEKSFENIKTINVNLIAVLMFWSAIIFSIIAVFAIVRLTTVKKLTANDDKSTIICIFFLEVFIVTSIFSLYKFAYDCPFVSSMNFRYIVAVLPVTCTLLGLWIERDLFVASKKRKCFPTVLYAITFLFAFCSTVFIGALGFTK
ncbi:MAG: glycosyltransferase family 39 protein [Clostridiales bacterium]|nr:glycosyltransferase family 39 protein [Clostridiales bacterium]